MPDREKVIQALKHCFPFGVDGCRNCPYIHDVDVEKGCTQNLTDDIIALLKEQVPRVMTLEDVKKSMRLPVWVEYEQLDCWNGYGVPTSYFGDYVMIHGSNASSAHFESKYNVEWRCWTSRPSPEQMASTPWEGGEADG